MRACVYVCLSFHDADHMTPHEKRIAVEKMVHLMSISTTMSDLFSFNDLHQKEPFLMQRADAAGCICRSPDPHGAGYAHLSDISLLCLTLHLPLFPFLKDTF